MDLFVRSNGRLEQHKDEKYIIILILLSDHSHPKPERERERSVESFFNFPIVEGFTTYSKESIG